MGEDEFGEWYPWNVQPQYHPTPQDTLNHYRTLREAWLAGGAIQ